MTSPVKSMSLTNKQKMGQISEQLSEEYLISSGYLIMDRNWRYSRAEIDIIASIESSLVFVEVKSTQNFVFREPELQINQKKMNLLYDAAFQYMSQNNYDGEIRFDIISVVLDPRFKLHALNHYKDAFFPGL